MLENIGKEAKKVSKIIGRASTEQKNDALGNMARSLVENSEYILEKNQNDVINSAELNLTETLTDRLKLDESRVQGMADGLLKLIDLEDPVGKVEKNSLSENGLSINKVRSPFGVVAVIYEARPNVTSDVSGLCLKSGNASILRGSSYCIDSNIAVLKALREGLKASNLPQTSIQLVEDSSRELGTALMKLDEYVDLLVPRGGKGLIQSMLDNATVPYVIDGDGNVHLYVHGDADSSQANRIIINSKVQRPSVCNALETLIINKSYIEKNGLQIINELEKENVEVYVDESMSSEYPDHNIAGEEEYLTEFLDYKIAIKIVENVDEAIDHINEYSSGHTESILTKDKDVAEKFSNSIDSSVVFINASTRFTDGEIFGLGAEIGISTQKLHVRGPMGLEALTCERYIVEGNGQIRE